MATDNRLETYEEIAGELSNILSVEIKPDQLRAFESKCGRVDTKVVNVTISGSFVGRSGVYASSGWDATFENYDGSYISQRIDYVGKMSREKVVIDALNGLVEMYHGRGPSSGWDMQY